jgi:hypothetical protein
VVKKANYNSLVRIIKIALTILSAFPVFAFIGMGFLTKFSTVFESDFFIVYFIVIAFTFPLLLSNFLFKSNFFSLKSVFTFLIYPAIYLIAFVFFLAFNIRILDSYTFIGLIVILLWHALLIRFINKENFDDLDHKSTQFLLGLGAFGFFMILISFLRDYTSIISTDILVHNTVLNSMENSRILHLMPGGYSNMFTDQGYPIVFYHTFLFFIKNAFVFDFVKVAYYIDFVFTLLSSLLLVKFFHKHFGSYLWSLVGALGVILIFENIAYTAHYFLPQTLAFWFFLQIISNGKNTLKQLIFAVPLLITTHLFMGTYLAVILVLKHFYVERFLHSKFKYKPSLFFEGSLLLLVVVVLSYAGFSVENVFQKSTLIDVGTLTNPGFSDKFITLSTLMGFFSILFLIAAIRLYFKKIKEEVEVFSFMFVLIGLVMYFLAPTFAGKFFLGFGVFIMIIIISFIKDIRFKPRFLKILALVILFIGLGFNFAQQYHNLLPFLRQSSGTVSAVVEKDRDLLNYWSKAKPECLVLSDPQTQISIHSLGRGNSARGYYMTLDSRKVLASFVAAPSQDVLDKFYSFEEISDESSPLCFIMTARLRELVDGSYVWTEIIYNYKVDQVGELKDQDKVIEFMQDKYPVIYQDPYSIVYKLR